MKKKNVFIIVLCITASLWAGQGNIKPSSDGYSFLKDDYREPSTRSMAMGGVSIVSIEPSESILQNPAKLAEVQERYFWTPSLNLNAYSSLDLIKNGKFGKLLKAFSKHDNDTLIDILVDYYFSSNTGDGNFAGLDANFGYIQKGIGCRFDFSDNITSSIPKSLSNYTNYVDFKLSGGYGYRFCLGDDWTADIGSSVSVDFLRFKSVDTADITDYVSGTDKSFRKYIKDIPYIYGFSVPFNIGSTFCFRNQFKGSFVARNILGTHYMKNEGTSYKFNNGIKCDIGFAWDYKTEKPVQFVIETDVQDLFNSFDSGRCFLKHLHIGGEIGYKNMFFIRAGLNSGYWTGGAGFSSDHFKFDFAYYYKENGLVAGDRSQKCMSVRFSFGDF